MGTYFVTFARLYFLLMLSSVLASHAWAADYYVDSISGSNANPGLSGAPWKHITAVNNHAFSPGDVVHFKRGQTWYGRAITMAESGTATDNITISNYGDPADPLPLISMPAPLDEEVFGNLDLDIHTVNSGSATDQFLYWNPQASGSNSVKVSSDTYSGVGVSAKLDKVAGGPVSIYQRFGRPLAANMPVQLRIRVKVDSGSLQVRLKNLVTNNYLDDTGTWAVSDVPMAIYPVTAGWTDVVIDLQTDTAVAQMDFTFTASSSSVAYVDDIRMSTPWAVSGTNVYKRAFNSVLSNTIYGLYNGDIEQNRQTSLGTLGQDFDWYLNTSERVIYMYYAGDLASLDAETLYIHRGAYTAVDLAAPFLRIDGLAVEKSPVGIRVREDNTMVENSEVKDIAKCAIHSYKTVDSIAVPISNLKINNNHVHDSGCGIYSWRVHNSLISNNIVHDIRDSGSPTDNENISLQSGSNNIFEGNVSYDGDLLGITLWGGPGYPAFDNIIRNNTIYRIGYAGVLLGGDLGYRPNGEYRGYTYNNLIHNNICFDNGFGAGYENRGSGLRQNDTPADGDGRNLWFNNTLYANRINFSGSSGFAGGFDYKNNVSLSPIDRHLDFSGGVAANYDLTITDLSHNLYYPDGNVGDGLFKWQTVYDTLAMFQAARGKDLVGSLTIDPLLTNPDIDPIAASFLPTATSSTIDAAVLLGPVTDFAGSSIYGLPDMGALEYQPPYTMGIDKINVDANARVYADGRFRHLALSGGSLASLSLVPPAGWSSGQPTWFMNVIINTWQTGSGDARSITLTPAASGDLDISIGDLPTYTPYLVQIDGVDVSAGITDTVGELQFNITLNGVPQTVTTVSASSGTDSEDDGLSDAFEQCYDGDCSTNNAYDPLSNTSGTDLDSSALDTDNDGYNDGVEIAAGSDPLDAESAPLSVAPVSAPLMGWLGGLAMMIAILLIVYRQTILKPLSH